MSSRRKNLLPLPPGLVLLVCAVLPAYYDSCAGTIYPYEMGPVLVPYALGLSIVVWSLAGGLDARGRWAHWQLVALGQLCYWVAGIMILLGLWSSMSDGDSTARVIGIWVIVWLLPIRPAVRSLRRQLAAYRAVQSLWLGAYGCAIWFSVFSIPYVIVVPEGDDPSHPLFGIWLALAASVALVGTGLYLARGAQRNEPAGATTLPKTRVERVGD